MADIYRKVRKAQRKVAGLGLKGREGRKAARAIIREARQSVPGAAPAREGSAPNAYTRPFSGSGR